MNDKEMTQYLYKMECYTNKVLNKEITPQESLNSLIKSGICNEQGKLNKPYK